MPPSGNDPWNDTTLGSGVIAAGVISIVIATTAVLLRFDLS